MGLPGLSASVEESSPIIIGDGAEVFAFINNEGALIRLIGEDLSVLPNPPDYYVGQDFFNLIPSELAHKGRDLLTQVLESGQSKKITFRKTVRDSVYRYEIKFVINGPDNLLVIIRSLPKREGLDNELLLLNRAFLTLQSASLSVTASLDFQYILDTFTWEITNLLDASGCIVSNWNQKAGTISILAAYPHQDWCRVASQSETYFLEYYPLTRQVLLDRLTQQIILDQSNFNLPEHEYMKRSNISTLLMLPMIYQNQTIGLVEIIGRDGQSFSNQEISLGQLLTNEAASALINARLYEQLNQRLKEISTLKRIGQAIVSTLDTSNALTTVTEGAITLMGVEAVSVALVENDGENCQFVAATGLGADFIQEQRLDLSEGIVGWVIRHGEPSLVLDVTADPRHYTFFDRMGGFQTKSILSVPLQTKGQTIGAISAINKTKGHFNQEDLRLLSSLSNPAATAIENARLYERAWQEIADRRQAEVALKKERAMLAQRVEERTITLQHQYERQQALATIEPTISHPNKLKNVLQQIVDAADSALPENSAASIVLWDKDKEEFYVGMASSRITSNENGKGKWHGAGTSQKILDSQQILVVPDVAKAPYGTSDRLQASGIRSYVGLPLIGQGQSLGIIYITSYQQRDFSQDEIDFYSALASRAAVAISNVMLYKTLQHTNAELARVSQMKDEFLASMSHELRTPLNAILGVSEGLIEEYYGSLNQDQRKSVQIIAESGSHLLALINDILDVTKVESGQLTLEIEPLFVKNICESSLQFIRQSAFKKQISIKLNLDEKAEIIYADARRLKQILINLLSNAVKFTSEGGSVGLEVGSDRAEGFIHFTVWDTGIGIAPEDLKHLFRPFYQLDSTLSRRYAGTGLGLALVKHMAKMHDGRVTVESEVGQGSRFTVSLPWHLDGEDYPVQPQSWIEMGRDPSEDNELYQTDFLIGPKILIVDDDKVNTKLFKELLSLKGFQVVAVNSGEEALQVINTEKPDLILMDIQMPGMDGLETIRQIRSQGDYGTLPIIALTALAMETDRLNCLEAGASDYLSKPVPLQKLVKTIRNHLQKNDMIR